MQSSLWRAAGRSRRYVERLAIWTRVLREIKGCSSADRRAIRAAFLRAPLTSARSLDEWQNPELLTDADVVVAGIGRYSIRAGTDDLYHVLPSRERAVTNLLNQRLKPGMTFVDAGANIGFFTVLASRLVGPSGKVLAVEMMPPTARRLHHHLAANGCDNVQVVERALSDTSGQSLPVSMVDGSFGTATIAAELPKAAGSVQTATLDELLASIPSVDLMKMDLEGAEPNALAGANASMGKIKAIVFEELAGGPASAMLERAGYSVRRLSPQMSLAER